MKTDAERMALIRQRTAQLQRQARARQMLLKPSLIRLEI